MNFKDYLKPDRSKILISLLLIGISVLITGIHFVAERSYPFVYPFDWWRSSANILIQIVFLPFLFSTILFYNIPIYFIIIIFILVSYPFGCYISQNKKWVKGIILYLVTFIIVSIGIYYTIDVYNNTVGSYCNADYDCRFICGVGGGAVNNRYIPLIDHFISTECFGEISTICENNKCKTVQDFPKSPSGTS